MAYWLELPEEFRHIHDTFNVSKLRKYIGGESIVVPLEDIQVDERVNYVEKPVAILDRRVKTLRNKVVNLVKVQWEH